MRRLLLALLLGAASLAAAQGPPALLPGSPLAADRECEGLAARGELGRALACLEARLADHPADAETHARLAQLLAGERSLADAVRHLERARELQPQDYRFAWNLGLLYADQQRSDEAIEAFRAVLRLQPDFAPAYRSLAFSLQQRQRLAEAEQVMEGYLQRAPEDPEALYFMGTLATERNQFERAEAWMRRALAIQPDSGAARYGLGLILSHDPGRTAEALAELERARRVSPKEPLVPYLIGSLKLQQGDVAGAITALEQAVELDPTQPHALYTLAQATIRAGQRDRGRALLQEFQAKKTRSADQDARQRAALAAFGRGRELLASGDVVGAASSLREAASGDAGNPHTWAQLAKVELSLGEAAAALESISMARGLAAGESEYLFLESVALAQLGRAQEAKVSAEQAVRRDPTVASYHNQLGLVLQKLNLLGPAVAAYRRAAELMPQEASYLLNLATALEASGDQEASAAAMARYQSLSAAKGPSSR